jgi:hypothetical protein
MNIMTLPAGTVWPCESTSRVTERHKVADRTRRILELGLEQLRHEVVGGMVGAPVDVLREERTVGEAMIVVVLRHPVCATHSRILVVNLSGYCAASVPFRGRHAGGHAGQTPPHATP